MTTEKKKLFRLFSKKFFEKKSTILIGFFQKILFFVKRKNFGQNCIDRIHRKKVIF